MTLDNIRSTSPAKVRKFSFAEVAVYSDGSTTVTHLDELLDRMLALNPDCTDLNGEIVGSPIHCVKWGVDEVNLRFLEIGSFDLSEFN